MLGRSFSLMPITALSLNDPLRVCLRYAVPSDRALPSKWHKNNTEVMDSGPLKATNYIDNHAFVTGEFKFSGGLRRSGAIAIFLFPK